MPGQTTVISSPQNCSNSACGCTARSHSWQQQHRRRVYGTRYTHACWLCRVCTTLHDTCDSHSAATRVTRKWYSVACPHTNAHARIRTHGETAASDHKEICWVFGWASVSGPNSVENSRPTPTNTTAAATLHASCCCTKSSVPHRHTHTHMHAPGTSKHTRASHLRTQQRSMLLCNCGATLACVDDVAVRACSAHTLQVLHSCG